MFVYSGSEPTDYGRNHQWVVSYGLHFSSEVSVPLYNKLAMSVFKWETLAAIWFPSECLYAAFADDSYYDEDWDDEDIN